MDSDVMARALKSVLGEGYESQSRVVGGTSSRTPSPHDFLQGRVAKNGPTGGDLHVPTSLGADRPKKAKGRLKSVEYVSKGERKDKVAQHLVTAGALGGALSLPSLYRHTKGELRRAGGAVAAAPSVPKATGKIRGALRPAVGLLEAHPKVGAGLAAGTAGLELAGLTGDFVAHSALRDQTKPKKTPVLKALAATPTEEVITFSKVDEEKRQVFGWCSVSKKDGVEVVDLQGDFVPIEEIEKSAYAYMLTSRKGGNQHARITKNFGMAEMARGDEPVHVGDCIESMVFTPEKIEKMGLPADFPQGWWFGLQIHDEETWGQIKRGERAGFSLHGKGRREAYTPGAQSGFGKRLQSVVVEAQEARSWVPTASDVVVESDPVARGTFGRPASVRMVDLQAGRVRKAALEAGAAKVGKGRGSRLNISPATTSVRKFANPVRIGLTPGGHFRELPLVDARGTLVPLSSGLVGKSAVRAGFSRRHVVNPITGKGRREELVAKAKTAVVPDRKEQFKDVSLGVAGATAAGSGAGGALVPLAAKKGLMDAVKAERVGGRLKTLGSIVGGTAGVYGGLHAAHQAATNPKVRALPATARAKVEQKVGLKKAWTPTVHQPSPEGRRQRRAQNYQRGAAVGAGVAVAGVPHQLRAARKAGQTKGTTTLHLERGIAQARVADTFSRQKQDLVNAHLKRLNAKVNQRGVPQMKAAHERALGNLDAKAKAERRARLSSVGLKVKAHNLRAVESAGKHSRRAGKLGLLGAGLAGAAGVINHQRKGSWRPYSGS